MVASSRFARAVLTQRPIAFYLGAPDGDATTEDFVDRAGKQNATPMRIVNSTVARHAFAAAGGDDSGRKGWRSGAGWARRGGGLVGFSGSVGTILCGATVDHTTLSGSPLSQGLFDTAPAQVGAMRVFTEDGWASIRADIGGENNSGVLAAQRWFPAGGAAFVHKRPHLFGVGWRNGFGDASLVLWVDAAPRTFSSWTVAPGSNNFDWGAYNSNMSHATHHFIAVFDRFLNVQEQQHIYRAWREAMASDRNAARLLRR